VSSLRQVVRLKLIIYDTTTLATTTTRTTIIPCVQWIKSRRFPRIYSSFEVEANYKCSLERQRIKQDAIITA